MVSTSLFPCLLGFPQTLRLGIIVVWTTRWPDVEMMMSFISVLLPRTADPRLVAVWDASLPLDQVNPAQQEADRWWPV